MASRATWRTAPGDPRSRLGWLAREGPRWTILVLRKAMLGVAGLALYAAILGAAPAFFFASIAFVALLAAEPTHPKPPASADPSPGLLFTGFVEVWREGAILGEDRVAATFVDAWLHVEGFLTAFALRGGDVVEIAEAGSATALRLRDGTDLRFRVTLDPRSQRRGTDANFVRFGEEAKRWWMGLAAVGESVLPPNRPHPSAFARTTADLTGAALGILAVFAAFVLLGPVGGFLSIVLVPGPRLIEATRGFVRLRRLARRG